MSATSPNANRFGGASAICRDGRTRTKLLGERLEGEASAMSCDDGSAPVQGSCGGFQYMTKAREGGAHYVVSVQDPAARELDLDVAHRHRPTSFRQFCPPFSKYKFYTQFGASVLHDPIESRMEAVHELMSRVNENDALVRIELS